MLAVAGTASSAVAQNVATRAVDSPPIPTVPLFVLPTDYPADSLLANEEGTLSLVLIVSADGKVTNATLDVSSGFPRLDAKAMAVAKARWRFMPAIRSGHAVSDSVKVEVVWNLPFESYEGYLFPDDTDMPAEAFLAGGMPPRSIPGTNLVSQDDVKQAVAAHAQGEVIAKVLVGDDGTVRDVRVADSSGFKTLDAAVVSAIRRHFKYAPGRIAGKPAAMWTTVRSSLLAVGATDKVAAPPRFCHAQPYAERNAVRGAAVDKSGIDVQPWLRIGKDGKVADVLSLTNKGWVLWEQPLLDELNSRVHYPPPHFSAGSNVCWVSAALPAKTTEK